MNQLAEEETPPNKKNSGQGEGEGTQEVHDHDVAREDQGYRSGKKIVLPGILQYRGEDKIYDGEETEKQCNNEHVGTVSYLVEHARENEGRIYGHSRYQGKRDQSDDAQEEPGLPALCCYGKETGGKKAEQAEESPEMDNSGKEDSQIEGFFSDDNIEYTQSEGLEKEGEHEESKEEDFHG